MRAEIQIAFRVHAVALDARVLEDLVDLPGAFLFVLRESWSGEQRKRDSGRKGAGNPAGSGRAGMIVAEIANCGKTAFFMEV